MGDNDLEAKNLIVFLGVNKHEVYEHRIKHISRIRTLKSLCGDDNIFLNKMAQDRDNLSFATALEHNFPIDVDSLIEEAINK